MADMSNPEGVRQIAGQWGEAADALHGHAASIRSLGLGPERFGNAYADQMAGVRGWPEEAAETWSGWGGHCETHGGNLHVAVDTYIGTDEGNAEDLGLDF